MNKLGWSRQVLLRYSLMQLPELVMLILILVLLRHWMNIPMWTVWIFISFLVIFNVILFPFVWRAYDKGNPNPMIGLQGIAVDRLSPSGYVRINGELWRSKVIKDDSAIEKGEVVTVKGMRRLTLIVQSDKKLNT